MTTLRYAIVTSQLRGYAGLFVQGLTAAAEPAGTSAVAVVLCENRKPLKARRRLLVRRARKVAEIGVIGTLNGLRMRRWYGEDLSARLATPDIEEAASQARIPVIRISSFNDAAGQEMVKDLALDTAVSMGNGYIARRFYEIPRFGMINIHHEWLPEYRGAQTVLWQLHDNSLTTGYTIHEISNVIDAGSILYRERVPITLRSSLRDTVVETSAEVQRRSLDGLTRVLAKFEEYRQRPIPNNGERQLTTPGTLALLRILRNHRRLRREQATRSDAATA